VHAVVFPRKSVVRKVYTRAFALLMPFNEGQIKLEELTEKTIDSLLHNFNMTC